MYKVMTEGEGWGEIKGGLKSGDGDRGKKETERGKHRE